MARHFLLSAACRFAATLLPLLKCMPLHLTLLISGVERSELCKRLFKIRFINRWVHIFDIGMLRALQLGNGKNQPK